MVLKNEFITREELFGLKPSGTVDKEEILVVSSSVSREYHNEKLEKPRDKRLSN